MSTYQNPFSEANQTNSSFVGQNVPVDLNETEINSIFLGEKILNGELLTDQKVKIILKNLNRHGLISGATGTGKTKSLQLLCEQLFSSGVSVLAMDMKGDLSGLSQVGELNSKVQERIDKMRLLWNSKSFPVEFLNISNDLGVKLRSTVSEFGPVLFSKILNLNDTQTSVMSMIFKYCDDNGLLLIDLEDIKKVLTYLTQDGRVEIQKIYGQISPATMNIIMRQIIQLEQQGAADFFGEPSFQVSDLLNNKVNIFNVDKIQDKPMLFSTFMLSLLAEIYGTYPEVGDLEKPKLIIFIDEAHLIFDNATNELKSQLETVIKLIRSKGVGIVFITQHPTDIPESILAQLSLKIQHALRAFTPKDRKDIKLIADNFPITKEYDVEDVLTNLGIGEALVTSLDENGIPTPTTHALICPPESRMDVITQGEKLDIINSSILVKKYDLKLDPESAEEIIVKRIEEKMARHEEARFETEKKPKSKETFLDQFGDVFDNPLSKQVGRNVKNTIAREITRNLFGMIGIGKK